MKLKVKSQLDHVEKGGILDDCGPSSTAAAVGWASKYVVDPSAGDGIKAKAKATGFVEKEGVSDNGSSLGDLIKTAKQMGAKADWRKRWNSEAPGAGGTVGVGRLKVTRERSMPVLVLWIKWPAGLSWLREAASRSLWARSLSDHGGWQDRFHSDSRVIASPYPSWKPCTRPTAAV